MVKVGDKVRYVGWHSLYKGREGEVVEIKPDNHFAIKWKGLARVRIIPVEHLNLLPRRKD